MTSFGYLSCTLAGSIIIVAYHWVRHAKSILAHKLFGTHLERGH